MEMNNNRTLATEVVLLGFSKNPKINAALFLLFSVVYLTTIIGNGLMICIILISPHLHIPMYFFLCNLSFIDFFYSSTAMPKLLVDLVSRDRTISIAGCGIQVYISVFLGDTECFILALMAYDRYVAICRPLYYPILMRWSACVWLASFVWILSFLISVVPSLLMPMRVCNPNQINHFMCEVIAVIKLSCDNIYVNQLVIFSISFFTLLLPFTLIVCSYVCIISSVLKIHSVERSKTFSTCTSHITVVGLFYGTAMVMYFGPSSQYSTDQEKFISVFYVLVIPMLNPLIYSLKNEKVKKAFLLDKSLSRSLQ
ncbi:PREDICTED: olfactory receptor 2A12-like [Nanorana parkeri]|uniref:olfactory receptor 2A12-like n=1 Tax=Nanorana parkeri TaxID=125878 RepID=UPI000854C9C6|nr:PREDICTED: olfactory receptor 2A12-like [Nanorana parkeri]